MYMQEAELQMDVAIEGYRGDAMYMYMYMYMYMCI